MAYATASDVQTEFRSIDFGAQNAALETAEVIEFIAQEEALLNAKLAGVYSIPITGSASLSIMKLLTIKSVKARIQDILAVKVGNPIPEQGNPSEALRKEVADIVDKLVNRVMLLTDATQINGMKSYNSENSDTLVKAFESDTEQW